MSYYYSKQLTALIFSYLSSSSKKKLRYWMHTSTSTFPPSFRCNSIVSWPPLNAYLFICEKIFKLMLGTQTHFLRVFVTTILKNIYIHLTLVPLKLIKQGVVKRKTFVFICLGVSVRKIPLFSSEALILVTAPCNAGKNTEWINEGFLNPNLGA